MGPTYAIFKRELRSYFDSPIAYIFGSIFIVISGWFFFTDLFLSEMATMRGFFGITPFLYVFLAPALTMRLLAEETHSGNIEILSTMPVQEWQIVLGKYLASVALLTIVVLLTLPFPISVSTIGDLDTGPVIGGYLGLILMGSAYFAVGIFASSITRNQIVAFIVALGMTFFLFIAERIAAVLPDTIAAVFEYLSTSYHFQNIARGVVDSRDLVYYASVITVGLMLATQTLAARKWR